MITSPPVYVELIDGQIVQSDAEPWRMQKLAEHILRKPLLERRAWIADYKHRHGEAETERLRVVLRQVHEAQKP